MEPKASIPASREMYPILEKDSRCATDGGNFIAFRSEMSGPRDTLAKGRRGHFRSEYADGARTNQAWKVV